MSVVEMKRDMSEAEWQTRVDLAALYRLIHHYGWSDLFGTHISARIPDQPDMFLLNPYGYLFEEITASMLVKVDEDGHTFHESDHGINPAGFTIHSAVHGARPDVGCVMHLHTDDGVAVSSQAHGLLPLTQTAMTVSGNISYHDYEGIALDLDERSRLVANLGDSNIMILRNHGTMTCGPDVQQAFLSMFMLERACTMQIRALSGGTKLNMPSDKSIETVKNQMASGSGSLAGLAWPSLLRMLDGMDPSFRD